MSKYIFFLSSPTKSYDTTDKTVITKKRNLHCSLTSFFLQFRKKARKNDSNWFADPKKHNSTKYSFILHIRNDRFNNSSLNAEFVNFIPKHSILE